LPSLIQKLKVLFLPNASHVKGPWKRKKEFKRINNTNKNRKKVRNENHSGGDGKKKDKVEKKT